MTVRQTVAQQSGFALIAVLVVLSLLLALAVPFALSMGRGEAVAFHQVDEKQVEWGSASVRDRLLAEAARGHPSVDPSLMADSTDEYPSRTVLPESFAPLRQDGQLLLAGEAWDLQRKINLNSASPLLLANLLDLVARLQEETPPDADVLVVDRIDSFPEEGFLLVDGELVYYEGRTDNAFTNLSRGILPDLGFVFAIDHTIPADTLVLDFRTVLAVTWPYDERYGGARDVRTPYDSVDELLRIEEAGFGGFTSKEMDLLRAHGTVASSRLDSGTWGRAERVFNDLEPGDRVLRVRSNLHLGAGSTVRIRSLETGAVEHGLVISTEIPTGTGLVGDINLPSDRFINLLKPLNHAFVAIDTVVEPLVPHPVNINTASDEVLVALMRHVRRALRRRPPPGARHIPAPRISLLDAQELARRIVVLRGGTEDADPEGRPFDSFEDLFERWIEPRLEQADGNQKARLVLLYRNLRIGRDGDIDMGTAPVSFTSGDAVGYRAAAAYRRSRVARSTAARLERRGIAAAMPGHALDKVWATQEMMELAFRLDRRAPWYLTRPVNTGTVVEADPGSDPGPRYLPHLMAEVYPGQGYGQTRFPSRRGEDAGFRSAPATTPLTDLVMAHEGFPYSQDAEGREVSQEGPYEMINLGPSGLGSAAVSQPVDPTDFGSSQRQLQFPFSTTSRLNRANGITSRHAVSFWMTPRNLGNQVVYDLSADDPDHNRISVQILDGEILFEVMDEAGVDPDPQVTGTSPDRTAGTWRVPLVDLALRPDVPVHLNFSAYGNRPGQLSLLVDGVPRGDPDLITYLTAPVSAYEPADTGLPPPEQHDRFLELRVEDTEGFPERGVLRVGLELFEYTSKTANAFHCDFRDSMGGRSARMSLWEYAPGFPTRQRHGLAPDINEALRQLSAAGLELDVGPDHAAGVAVELYGYSIPLYRDFTVQVGEASLADALGPFAVARVINDPGTTIDVVGPSPPTPPRTRTVGVGLDATTTEDIVLGDPLIHQQYPPPGQVDRDITDSFPASGGYALLVQKQLSISFQQAPGQLTGIAETVGGIEVIRYAARRGQRLTGIQRGAQLRGMEAGVSPFFSNAPRKFVSDWDEGMRVGPGAGTAIREIPSYLLYVVPISIAVNGGVNLKYINEGEPSEWVQIYSPDDEASTEWVRYNLIVEDRHLVRANLSAWESVRLALTRQVRTYDVIINPLGGAIPDPAGAAAATYGQPVATSNYIGYVDQVEEDFPPVAVARQALGFRGDPFTDTTSHQQELNASVLPVHRLEMNPGNYAALWGRVGRNDRTALVNGSQAAEGTRPTFEWHSVNWTARRPTGDRTDRPISEPLGLYPFQLVAFKERVGAALFQGTGNPDDDPQFVDRLVKFPSGELPAAYSESALFGGSQQGDGANLAGTVDELMAVQHRAEDLLLDEPMSEGAVEFVVRTDLELFGSGPLVGGDMTEGYPVQGGLVAIDGEILAFQSHENGRFQVARNGRGLLHTETRAHDEGSVVHFLTHVPAAILLQGLNALDHQVVVQDMGNLPRGGGTLLVAGQELCHYTWSRSRTVLEMPRWFEEGREDIRGRGLFRARFGTEAVGAEIGEAVILFPFRYWDRHHDQADDPEMAYFQLTYSGSAPVLFTELTWQEEVYPDVDLHCLLRVDGKGSFAGDPEQNPDLLLFTDGEEEDQPLQLFRQGTSLEARFYTVYRRGAFDTVDFLAHGWKSAPLVNWVLVGYEGESRVLEEVTGR